MYGFKIVVINEFTGEKTVFDSFEAVPASAYESDLKNKIHTDIISIVPNSECANCCGNRSKDMSGVCNDCFNQYMNGYIIKTKDTVDKDDWTCGCIARPEGVYYCSTHQNNKDGPLKTFLAPFLAP